MSRKVGQFSDVINRYPLHGVSVPFPPRCHGAVGVVIHSTGYRNAAHFYRDLRPSPVTRGGRCLDRQMVYRLLSSLCPEVGLRQLTFRNLGQANEAALVSLGVDQWVVAYRLGGAVNVPPSADEPGGWLRDEEADAGIRLEELLDPGEEAG